MGAAASIKMEVRGGESLNAGKCSLRSFIGQPKEPNQASYIFLQHVQIQSMPIRPHYHVLAISHLEF